jgi:hypothetical protein
MSADNGIYIAEFPGPIYRVIEASAIENCYDAEDFSTEEIDENRQDYFRNCEVFISEREALNEAEIISDLVGWTEYGIQRITFDRPLSYNESSSKATISRTKEGLICIELVLTEEEAETLSYAIEDYYFSPSDKITTLLRNAEEKSGICIHKDDLEFE